MKEFFGMASLLASLVGYVPYLKDILAHKTKPHALTWLVWSVLSAIAFGIQVTHNAGPGSWLLGSTTVVTLIIFALSIKYGEKNILLIDWLSFACAGLALVLWLFTDRPLASVIILAFIDAVGGFLPTLRKSITKPHEETAILYFLYAVSLGFSLLALQSFTLVNALYPASFIVINLSMTLFLVLRRRTIAA